MQDLEYGIGQDGLCAPTNGKRCAEAFSAHEPAMLKYPDFKEVLLLFSEAGCKGCRDGICMYPGCPIYPCIKEKRVDFCFECEEFPCDYMGADYHPRDKWLHANKRMKEIGVKAYFDAIKDESHYL